MKRSTKQFIDKLNATKRLEYLRKQIQSECISYGEIAELQGLAKYIDPSDVLLLEWAGVPEGSLTCDNAQYEGGE